MDGLERERELLRRLSGAAPWFKVGLQLFTACGRKAVEAVRRTGAKVFLDLKLHDIPKTVELAVRQAAELGADAVSLHLSGGAEMVRAAASVSPRPQLWGVTVLTSLSPQDARLLRPRGSLPGLAADLARCGLANGADALICSPREVAFLRRALPGRAPRFVTPGIRPAGAGRDDQARAETPERAAALGVDYAVVGRPITQARDPRAAALAVAAALAAPERGRR